MSTAPTTSRSDMSPYAVGSPARARRLALCLAVVTAWIGLGALPASASEAAEQLPATAFQLVSEDLASRYDATYQVNRDGSVDITQTIDWTFPDAEERHGIIRTVTVRAGYQDSQTQYRYYSLSNVEVSSPTGAPTDVSISDFGAEKQIRIGSPTRTVSGTQTYLVSFRLEHVVNDIGDGTAEFYYNHVAPSNEYDYRQVTASVTGPAAATRAACGRMIRRISCNRVKIGRAHV